MDAFVGDQFGESHLPFGENVIEGEAQGCRGVALASHETGDRAGGRIPLENRMQCVAGVKERGVPPRDGEVDEGGELFGPGGRPAAGDFDEGDERAVAAEQHVARQRGGGLEEGLQPLAAQAPVERRQIVEDLQHVSRGMAGRAWRSRPPRRSRRRR